MIILSIETSCDETAAAVLKAEGGFKKPRFKILSNIVSSQVKIHRPYGGVVPNLAKREHQKNLIPVLKMALSEAKLLKIKNLKLKIKNYSEELKITRNILEKEEILLKKTISFFNKYEASKIDLIAATVGPGLAPALWPGVNLVKTLAYLWEKPILGINHVKAHIFANWLNPICENPKSKIQNPKIIFPVVCLVVSGGHTQLILMRDFGKYKIIGETRDDAAGEAFDKVARLLGLGYPGGPAIAKIANMREFATNITNRNNSRKFVSKFVRISDIKLPRPMINQNNFDFSFSGLKTAVLYLLQDLGISNLREFPANFHEFNLDKERRQFLQYTIAKEFQQSVIDVLITKTIGAAKKYKAKTILLSGGVAANEELRRQMKEAIQREMLDTKYFIPPAFLCTDNAAMVAVSAYFDYLINPKRVVVLESERSLKKIVAEPNLRIK